MTEEPLTPDPRPTDMTEDELILEVVRLRAARTADPGGLREALERAAASCYASNMPPAVLRSPEAVVVHMREVLQGILALTPEATAPDTGSEYGRLLAERDRLISEGVDPADLEAPLPPEATAPDPDR